jgi:hypothetical protein
MYSLRRTFTLLAICALAAFLVAPAAAPAQGGSDAGNNYVLDVPATGSGGEGSKGSSAGSNEGGSVPAAAADGADEGGLPILLIILGVTALAGASIAIIRRQKT